MDPFPQGRYSITKTDLLGRWGGVAANAARKPALQWQVLTDKFMGKFFQPVQAASRVHFQKRQAGRADGGACCHSPCNKQWRGRRSAAHGQLPRPQATADAPPFERVLDGQGAESSSRLPLRA